MNAQKDLDELINRLQSDGKKPSLLLHCCCGPCASYCIDYLHDYFTITALFFNPNIMPKSEYDLRLKAFNDLLDNFSDVKKIIVGGFEDEFRLTVKGSPAWRPVRRSCRRCPSAWGYRRSAPRRWCPRWSEDPRSG